MIEIQVGLRENLGTILTGVPVAKKNVLPCELYLLTRDAIIKRQNNDFGNPQSHLDGMDQFSGRRFPLLTRILYPRSNIVGLVATFPLGLHHLGMAQAKKF
jgi:hypothetical protein